MPARSTIELKVRTGSDDRNCVLLLIDDELVAIIVELSDAVHGDARGRWSLEASFGPLNERAPQTFASVAQASDWFGRATGGENWSVVPTERKLL